MSELFRKFMLPTYSTWNKEEFSYEWKVSIVAHIYRKAERADLSNC